MSYMVQNSPHVRRAQKAAIDPKGEAWPPKSPFEALLSSPSGRKKAEQRALDRDGSPGPRIRRKLDFSPGKGLASSPVLDEEDEDDEETLQLQLAAIQARLKLKKLQKSHTVQDLASLAGSRSDGRIKHHREASFEPDGRPEKRARVAQSSASVNVLQSPDGLSRPPVLEQRSPGRVRLGLDNGRRAQDVSLSRPPRYGGPVQSATTSDAVKQAGNQRGLIRSTTQTLVSTAAPPRTFSDKLNETRRKDQAEQDRLYKQQQTVRSHGFGVSEEVARLQKATAALQAEHMEKGRAQRGAGLGIQDFDRSSILRTEQRNQNYADEPIRAPARSQTMTDMSSFRRQEASSHTASSSQPSIASSSSFRLPTSSSSSLQPSAHSSGPPDADLAADLDPFSSLYLSRRNLTAEFLRHTFAGKRIFKITDLLRVVKSPNYSAPDCPEDWIVLGIVASKSEPRSHQQHPQRRDAKDKGAPEQKGKYMVISLTDLKWQVDLFLFGASFIRYRGVTAGTLIAIMNPNILAPRAANRENGKFSICISDEHAGRPAQAAESSAFHSRHGDEDEPADAVKSTMPGDSLLELGQTRDLGWCKSTKSDGSACRDWVDRRRSEFCDFHVNLEVSKRQRGRMEVNSMVGRPGPGAGRGGGSKWQRSNSGSRQYEFGRGGASKADSKSNLKNGGWELGQYYVTPGGGGAMSSSAALLDAEEPNFGPSTMLERGLSRDERAKRQMARSEKEREVARMLSLKSKDAGDGGGIGGVYLRSLDKGLADGKGAFRVDGEIDADERLEREEREEKLRERLKQLGPEGRKGAEEVKLSPIRRQRREFSVGITGMGMGFGMANGGRSREASPVKMRQKGITRFLTKTGIKEAGMDISTLDGAFSAGDPDAAAAAATLAADDSDDNDDEDELDIV